MGILKDFEKDKLWDQMDDMKVLGMERDDLEMDVDLDFDDELDE
jgi:hypothetical protein